VDRVKLSVKLRVRVRAGVEQPAHRFKMPFARREVDRLVIEGDVGIALEYAAKRGDVAGNASADRIPNIAPTAGPGPIRALRSEFIRLDHVQRLVEKRKIAGNAAFPDVRAPRPSDRLSVHATQMSRDESNRSSDV